MQAAGWDAARTRSQALAAQWQRSAERRMLAATFDDPTATDLPLARRRAETLLGDAGWAEALIAPLVSALRDEPLLDPPLRVNREGGRIGAVLFEAPAVRLSVSILSAAALAAAPEPAKVALTGRVAVTRYLAAGDALVQRWTAPPIVDGIVPAEGASLHGTHRPHDGAVSVLDGRTEGQVMLAATRDVVTLTALLRAGAAPLMRQYATRDGTLMRSATTDDGASRAAMLLTLLRVSGRADAAATFEAASRDRTHHLRWSAMREWLATDARSAWPRLAEMAAGDPHPEVRGAARATLARVAERRAA